MYPSVDGIVENNICEDVYDGFSVQANPPEAGRNKFLGNITRNAIYGAVLTPGYSTLKPYDDVYSNFVAINSKAVGVYFRSVVNGRLDQSTLSGKGFVCDEYPSSPGSNHSCYGDNLSLLGGASLGVSQQDAWLIDYINIASPGTFNPSSTNPSIKNASTIDPAYGDCTGLWVPDDSPMKGAGKNGSDIGANVLYRYENGMLTDKPLWNPITGEFPHGVIVAGVNDIPGSSVFDVHLRLSVNANGCPFPAGYGN
jgi:hypothetical protein